MTSDSSKPLLVYRSVPEAFAVLAAVRSLSREGDCIFLEENPSLAEGVKAALLFPSRG